ncbi:MAG: YkgJ family cysteine cluster protein [Gammaproteobacteria bacterium]
MSVRKLSVEAAGSPPRLSFPLAEAHQTWLPLLLEAYRIADAGVGEAIRREAAQGRQLACGKGCAACCRSHTTIPVYPLELMGMSWYVVEQLPVPLRARVRDNLLRNASFSACPFLVDEACSIHPLRPLACRHFNVFDRVCAEGEDAYYTRRQDVMTPIKRYVDQAFEVMLPFYGLHHKAQRRAALVKGLQHGLAKVMKECNWPAMAARMDEYDQSSAVSSG